MQKTGQCLRIILFDIFDAKPLSLGMEVNDNPKDGLKNHNAFLRFILWLHSTNPSPKSGLVRVEIDTDSFELEVPVLFLKEIILREFTLQIYFNR